MCIRDSWCGNNEMESAWDHWGGFNDHSDTLKQDYLTMFEKLIPEALKTFLIFSLQYHN